MAQSAPELGQPAETAEQKKHVIVLMFSALVVVMLMASLNQTVLAPSLPTIVGELHGVEHMSWVITIFILMETITMPLYGKLSDQFGRKPFLVFAILVFAAGSIIGGAAQDLTTLIIARGLQGLGGGGLMILSQSVIADVIPARDRGKYMGVIGGVYAFSSVAGPLLGGWITEVPGWRWAFWINLPLAALSVFAVIFLLPHTSRKGQQGSRVDYLGSAILMVGTSALVLATMWGGNQYAWNSVEIITLLVIAVIAALVFIPVENRAQEPIMPMYLFKERNFVITTMASLALGIAMMGSVEYIPTYFQMSLGVSATVAGLLIVPMMAVLLITGIVTGNFVTKTGRYKPFIVTGTAIVALSLGLLGTTNQDSPVWLFCLYLSVMGLGLGLSMQFLTLVVQNAFPTSVVGTATAANNFFRQLGSTVGASLVGGLFTSRLTSLLSERLPAEVATSAGEHGASSLTPEIVASIPEPIHSIIVGSYNDALIPLFLSLVPVAAVAALLLVFIREDALATTVDNESAPSGAVQSKTMGDHMLRSASTGAIPVIDAKLPVDKSEHGAPRTQIQLGEPEEESSK